MNIQKKEQLHFFTKDDLENVFIIDMLYDGISEQANIFFKEIKDNV